jgi:hypothetical protein
LKIVDTRAAARRWLDQRIQNGNNILGTVNSFLPRKGKKVSML